MTPLHLHKKTFSSLLVGICSHRAAADRRDAVRETWMSSIPCGIECMFFVGEGAEPLPDAESKDVLELPAPDDYAHLPAKVFLFFPCNPILPSRLDL